MEKMLGVMLDCSRNSVMKPDTVKYYAQILKKMGYNTLMLYTEDTYELESQPYFGHLRGRYSKAELKDMDAYCDSIGVELIPCIQTLAHLKQMFKWGTVYKNINDCDDILLIGEKETYVLIEEMFKTVTECFRTKKIHIGMDEAYRVGTGEYLNRNGVRDRFDVINEHLHKVCQIASKYRLEPMIWSDMFCKLAAGQAGGASQYEKVDASKILEKASLPENVSLVYWDYYSTEYEHYVQMIERNKLFGRKVYFAGGAWTWLGFAPNNTFSIKATDVALSACVDNVVDGVFFTAWGDDGAECSAFAVLPALMFAAEKARGNTDMISIKAKFREIVGVDFESFMLLDAFDTPGGKHIDGIATSKLLLYNDPFMGIRDYLCSEEDNTYYEILAEKIHNITEKGDFALLFESYEKFARVLAVKAALGIKTREAYLAKNIETLKNLITEYDEIVERIKAFHKAYRKRWFSESKPHGFEIQDIRIGGVIQRVLSCKERLVEYINGEVDNIPELHENVLEVSNGAAHWWKTITANVVSH